MQNHDSDDDEENRIIFTSALEVGSTFVKLLPDEEEITFRYTRKK